MSFNVYAYERILVSSSGMFNNRRDIMENIISVVLWCFCYSFAFEMFDKIL